MKHFALLVALTVLLSLGAPRAEAAASATFRAERDIVVSSSSPANAYVAGGSVAVTAAVAGDLTVAGGSILLASPVAGDALLFGGTTDLRSAVAGDLRALSGRLELEAPVMGDVVAVAGAFTDTIGSARTMLVIAANATLGGARGPVTVYANNVALGGDYAGDVDVVASGRVALAPGTVIHGSLKYQSPEQVVVGEGATVEGGIEYDGASYLPTAEQTRAIALAGFGVFLLVKVLGLLMLAGLLAGLFPALTEAITERALGGARRPVVLTTLLGFAVLVATPMLLVLLAITFVGIGIALLVGAAYLLLCILAFTYAGIIIGAALARTLFKRTEVYWRDAIVGMLVLSVVWLVPVVGSIIVFLLTAFAAGALSRLFFAQAFPHDDHRDELL